MGLQLGLGGRQIGSRKGADSITVVADTKKIQSGHNQDCLLLVYNYWQFHFTFFQLKTKAKINKAVKTIQLVRSFNDIKAGTECLTAGWGRTVADRRAKSSDTLREVNVTVLERKLCNDKGHYNSKPLVTIDMVCAGDKRGGKDSCQVRVLILPTLFKGRLNLKTFLLLPCLVDNHLSLNWIVRELNKCAIRDGIHAVDPYQFSLLLTRNIDHSPIN